MKGTVVFRLVRAISGHYYSLKGIRTNLTKDEVRASIGLLLQEYWVVCGDIGDTTERVNKALQNIRNEIAEAGWTIELNDA